MALYATVTGLNPQHEYNFRICWKDQLPKFPFKVKVNTFKDNSVAVSVIEHPNSWILDFHPHWFTYEKKTLK